MANALGDLGELVTDHTLVLNVIRSLNECFTTIGIHLQRGRPFLTFLEERNELLLEELHMSHKSSTPSNTLLALSGTSSKPPSMPRSSSQPQFEFTGGSSSKHGKRGGKKGSRPPSSDGKGDSSSFTRIFTAGS